ncbi:MAG TPA: hypothetical protein VJS44_15335 [Pyrinomonadaceae bacterium]|nr:hypothetical protein [Pyrinomonadaceae bacterium]
MFSKHFRFPLYIAAVALACISLSAVTLAAERGSDEPVNKRPLKDWLRSVKEANDRGELNLSVPSEVVIEANRTAQGGLTAPVVLKKQGDPKAALYFTNFVTALGESRALQVFRDANRFRFMLNLTQDEVRFAVSFAEPTPEQAGRTATGFNSMLVVGRLKSKGKTDSLIYENTKVSSSGKQVLFSLNLLRKDALTIINKLSTD